MASTMSPPDHTLEIDGIDEGRWGKPSAAVQDPACGPGGWPFAWF